jgi:hypothetical protein
MNNETPALTAPPWLLQALSRPPREKAEPIDGFEPDSPAAIESAREWLVDHAPEAIENRGGDSTTYNVACRVKDFGIAEETCFELMAEHWNPTKAIPPWTTGELEQKVANAYLYGTSPIGAASPEVQFGRVELEAETGTADCGSKSRSRLFIRSFDESRARSLTAISSPLIKKYLGRGEMSVLYGESGVGKTFISLDMAFHIASNRDWNGLKVNGGPVVYVAAEAGETINARIEALARKYKVNGAAPPLGVVPCLVDLYNPNADLKPLIQQILEWGDKHKQRVSMVSLDTLARVIGAGDENAARDMGMLVHSVDRIRVETGAHVMLVHHAGKNTAKGARGSSALRAATDTEIEVEDGKIKMRKQRSWELARPIPFQLERVLIGEDADGDSVTSCTVTVGAAVDFMPQLTPEQEEWLSQIRFYAMVEGKEELTTEDLQRAFDYRNTENAATTLVAASGVTATPIRTVRYRAATLQECGNLESVSNSDDKSKRYKLAATAATNAATASR